MNKKLNLKGKVVVITGASSGAGRAAALEFARHGASVVVAARREEVLNEVAEECRLLGGEALVVPTDVTDAGEVNTLAAMAQHWGGRIDTWINNAGVLAAGAFDETPISIQEKVIQTNLLGYIHGAHAVLPHFKAQGHGVLINNISVGGWFPTPYAAAYTASKFGLRGFGEALQGELHHYPAIHVCNLFPAFLDTPGIQHAANFTGKVLRPAPPVYNPQTLAEAMVAISQSPKDAAAVSSASTLLRLAHAVFPKLTRLITSNVINLYLRKADKTPFTTGNVLETVEYGSSVHGGWSLAPRTKAAIAGGAIAFTGVTVALAIFSTRR